MKRIKKNDVDCDCLGQLQNIKVKVLDVVVNNICNLQCDYCYYGHFQQSIKENNNLLDAIKVICDSQTSLTTLTVIGREPLLSWNNLLKILMIAKNHNLECGFITNGLLLRKYIDILINKACVSFINISYHIGNENYDKNFFEIIDLVTRKSKNQILLNCAMVILENNIDWLLSSVRRLSKAGVRNIFLCPYIDRFNRMEYVLTADTFIKLLFRLAEISEELNDLNIKIHICEPEKFLLLRDLFDKDIISYDTVMMWENLFCANIFNKTNLKLLFPISLLEYIIIDYNCRIYQTLENALTGKNSLGVINDYKSFQDVIERLRLASKSMLKKYPEIITNFI